MTQTPEPLTRDYDPGEGKPDIGVARAHFAQEGDVIEWAGGIRWRWDGEAFHRLQPGDVCRDARDGSSIVWNGQRWQPPRVDNSKVDDLARILDPLGFEVGSTVDDKDVRQELVREMARRALAHGWVLAHQRAAARPATYHLQSLAIQPGDSVDITWTNGRATHHIVTEILDGTPVLRTHHHGADRRSE